MPRLLLMILSDVLTADQRGIQIKCPGCGARLFDLHLQMPVETALPTMERMAILALDIKCRRCGRRVGLAFKTE
jgi:DNA-directed RNA polymerase subunit RPC12/RpoP